MTSLINNTTEMLLTMFFFIIYLIISFCICKLNNILKNYYRHNKTNSGVSLVLFLTFYCLTFAL